MAPQLVPLLMELLKFGVTGFKVGKSVEGTIDQALEQMKQQAAAQQGQPKPPDPKIEAEKIKMQGVQVKAQAEAQKAQMSV